MVRHCFDSSMLLGFDITISDRLMMASSSGEQVHSNRNYTCLLAQAFDGHNVYPLRLKLWLTKWKNLSLKSQKIQILIGIIAENFW